MVQHQVVGGMLVTCGSHPVLVVAVVMVVVVAEQAHTPAASSPG
eukprot:CAMPEP_0202908326 /NCGR_PEP_ID=MMETSP1392-20130828/45683_1 /ASSEMBLY_ACC=CAM_ASM_000868 /TAXON_ID=225041 /ORGANISM="Chlamydomonas chlamydogama, Strain SAG 11-48b" /LENGTH=43 /DNA_ID= /DNA_START= /DNA_END= /DNA_ORIENTATION=